VDFAARGEAEADDTRQAGLATSVLDEGFADDALGLGRPDDLPDFRLD
jgi:hypothetical protein